MEIMQILVLGLIAAVIVLLLRDSRPEIALQISIASGIIIFFMMIGKLTIVVQAIQEIAVKLNIDTLYLNIIFKIIGVAYLTSFGVELCKDSGQNSIAEKIEFAGKIIIITLGIPIFFALLEMAQKILL